MQHRRAQLALVALLPLLLGSGLISGGGGGGGGTTIPCAGCVDDASLANAYSGVGACAASKWVSTLNRNAPGTCTQPAFADLSGTLAHSAVTGSSSGDDHTQYLLLLGRATGQTAYGGTAAGDDLTLNSTFNASKGSIFFGSEWEWADVISDPADGTGVTPPGPPWAGAAWTPTLSITGTAGTSSTTRGVYLNPTYNYDDAAGVVINAYKAIDGGGTFTVSGAATQASSWTLFDATAVLDATVAAKVPPTPIVFHSGVTIRYSATSGTGTMGGNQDTFQDGTIYRNVDAGGTFTVPAPSSFTSFPTFTETAGALNITTARGFYFKNPTINNTPQITTSIGVDIEKPTRAGTGPGNIGLRNAGTTVYTNTTQAIAAATDTITCSASLMTLTTATGTTTLTSNPSIADGTTGQVCILLNIDSVATDCVGLTDSTLGMQLAGNDVVCQNDSLTVVYNGTDWIELDRSDN